MTISETMQFLERYDGSSPCPSDFEKFWRDQNEHAAKQKRSNVQMERVDFRNPVASYFKIRFTGTDGVSLSARYICPEGKRPLATVLMFHDYNVDIRGWHHMTRFAALGYAVVALENRERITDVTKGWRSAPEGLVLTQLYTDALTLAHIALDLSGTDTGRIITWGEGLGGGLAIAVAAMQSDAVAKCAVLNPLPADFYKVWEQENDVEFFNGIRTHFREQDPMHQESEAFFAALGYVDCAQFAPFLKGQFLMGSGLMDRIAPVAAQYAIYNKASCQKRHVVYPKYAHERINFFENELLTFLKF